jgi:hypothetical protein
VFILIFPRCVPHRFSALSGADAGKKEKHWERTNTANLWKLASTGGYYARVKSNGKEKWKRLKTKLSSVAKLGELRKVAGAGGGEGAGGDRRNTVLRSVHSGFQKTATQKSGEPEMASIIQPELPARLLVGGGFALPFLDK